MRQIPSEGEWCGECTCMYEEFCVRYEAQFDYANPKRLPQCLSDKPQVLTEEGRGILYLKGVKDGLAKAAANIYTAREDIEED